MIGDWDFFLSCLLYYFPYSHLSSYLLRLSLCLISSLLNILMRECFEKHSCMCFLFPIGILNGTKFFLSLVEEKLNMPSEHYYRHCCRSGRSILLIHYPDHQSVVTKAEALVVRAWFWTSDLIMSGIPIGAPLGWFMMAKCGVLPPVTTQNKFCEWARKQK